MLKYIFTFALLLGLYSIAQAQNNYPSPKQGIVEVKDFTFHTGEKMDLVKLGYTTIGTLKKDANGNATNAVLIMHGTTGSGSSFLSDRFAGNLFGKGQILDANEYFIILSDAIGHGRSSKPSDGLRMNFPRYNYDDMVNLMHGMLTEGLGVNHLRLVMGTSMGGMNSWVWGYLYPDFMDALMPLASTPVEIAGRNRMMRKMMMDAIMDDPTWANGNYQTKPLGHKHAMHTLIMMTSSPLQWQKNYPTRESAEAYLKQRVDSYFNAIDPNDLIYAFDASRDYNPSLHLEKIKAPLLSINSADDQVNPPELELTEQVIDRVPKGKFILLPITDETIGHSTHSVPAVWGQYLAEFLKSTEK
ncbi:alpha/beta fold hydrolase [Peijinzhouia sedimentorum]